MSSTRFCFFPLPYFSLSFLLSFFYLCCTIWPPVWPIKFRNVETFRERKKGNIPRREPRQKQRKAIRINTPRIAGVKYRLSRQTYRFQSTTQPLVVDSSLAVVFSSCAPPSSTLPFIVLSFISTADDYHQFDQ